MIHRVFFIPNSSKNWVFWNFLRGILQKFPFRSIKTLSFLVLFGNRALWIWLKALEQDKEKLPTRYNSLKKDWRCIVPEHWDRTGQYFWNRCFGSLLKKGSGKLAQFCKEFSFSLYSEHLLEHWCAGLDSDLPFSAISSLCTCVYCRKKELGQCTVQWVQYM